MNREQGVSRIRQMSRSAGGSRQANERASGGSAWTQRGRRKVEWMQRSDQEQRVNRNRGVSRYGWVSGGVGGTGQVSG